MINKILKKQINNEITIINIANNRYGLNKPKPTKREATLMDANRQIIVNLKFDNLECEASRDVFFFITQSPSSILKIEKLKQLSVRTKKQ